MPWKEIDACATSPTGAALLKASHFKTMELFAKHGGYTPPGHGYRPPLIPNIWIDGAQYVWKYLSGNHSASVRA